MWLFPYLTVATIAAIVVVIVAMATVKEVRSQLFVSLISLGVVALAGWLHLRRRDTVTPRAAGGPQPV